MYYARWWARAHTRNRVAANRRTSRLTRYDKFDKENIIEGLTSNRTQIGLLKLARHLFGHQLSIQHPTPATQQLTLTSTLRLRTPHRGLKPSGNRGSRRDISISANPNRVRSGGPHGDCRHNKLLWSRHGWLFSSQSSVVVWWLEERIARITPPPRMSQQDDSGGVEIQEIQEDERNELGRL